MEEYPLSVLDASVALKWFIEEENSDRAREIQDDFISGKIDLQSPDLLLYEVSNALKFNRTFNENEIKKALTLLQATGIRIFPVNYELIKSTVKISYDYQLTIYDSIYASLSIELKDELITADKKLFDKLNKKLRVVLLGN